MIDEHGHPNVLFIGSSHVERMQYFVEDCNTPDKYRDLLATSHFMGVGGMKWTNIHKWLNGVDLPEHKQHLGDLFGIYHCSHFHPHFVCLIVGSNDTDDVNTFCNEYKRLYSDEEDLTKKLNAYMNRWLSELAEFVESFFDELIENIPGCLIR